MNRTVKKYAAILAIIFGSLLTLESILEGNAMLLFESIGITIAGICYAFPVRDIINRILIDRRKSKQSAENKEGNSLTAL